MPGCLHDRGCEAVERSGIREIIEPRRRSGPRLRRGLFGHLVIWSVCKVASVFLRDVGWFTNRSGRGDRPVDLAVLVLVQGNRVVFVSSSMSKRFITSM